MRQDKGSGVVVLNRSKYTDKYLDILKVYWKQGTTGSKEMENNINNTRLLPVITHRLKPRKIS